MVVDSSDDTKIYTDIVRIIIQLTHSIKIYADNVYAHLDCL